MADFTERLRAVSERVRCEMCGERGERFTCISCEECGAHFHKTCVQPLRAEWPEGEMFMCDRCAEVCVVCGSDADDGDNQLVVCDNCNDWFHIDCLPEAARPEPETVGDETEEWYCVECTEEYASDNEWAEEHIVDDAEGEPFTRSACTCEFCAETNAAVDTWREFRPRNPIQASLKRAIDEKEGLVNTLMDNLHFEHPQ